MSVSTVTAAVLDPLLAADPAGPRITYYDDAAGERIELSTATLANWAAKTGNMLRDELGAGPGSRIAVLLPAHWQTAAVLFGIWWIGAEAVVNGSSADIALCTADRLADAEAAVGAGEIAVLSLDPFGKPATGVGVGVTDYATSVRVHADQITGERAAGAALDGRSVGDVLEAGRSFAAEQGLTTGDRVLSTARWDNADVIANHLVGVFAAGASLVLVVNPDAGALENRKKSEKVTRELT